ncbi:hypothetical protein D4740_03740 [Actinomyces sp. 2119]|uniref:WXG100 family type VII secretion target n=2 Tax=Actinomyces lilanjuaniae TaxID=2321394 RepID=A0ABN5PU35_9ACTO|nr:MULTISPECIES: hypothetical protein [Actinomyces]AYD90501.1 hypothetical protein D5R93_11735 [Actinomyces lilanjuaniae]RJF44048.1 hypothetical protein D4740_03740 [Actinomyces sp. 2119]
MSLQADLDTLAALYDTLSNNVQLCHDIQTTTDSSLASAVWESPNAEAFRAAWEEFRPKLMAFEDALAAGATDVANNHNNNAAANGVTDARQLAPVAPVA